MPMTADVETRRRVPIETRLRRVASARDPAHEYDEHLDALHRGRHPDCFCVRPPYIRWVAADLDRS